MKNKNYKVYAIDAILVVATLVALGSLWYYSSSENISLSPSEIDSSKFLFSFSNVEKILIDDNSRFDSPTEFEVGDGLVIELDEGVYYWKLVREGISEVKRFELSNDVVFRIEELPDGNFRVVNAGEDIVVGVVDAHGKLKTNLVLEGQNG